MNTVIALVTPANVFSELVDALHSCQGLSESDAPASVAADAPLREAGKLSKRGESTQPPFPQS